MTRKEYVGAAVATTLSGAITPSSTSITIDATDGWPTGAVGPFVVVLDRGTADEEKVLCSLLTGSTLSVTTRGYDDTTAVSHALGGTIEHCLDSDTIDEANAHVNDTSRDDHTQYLNTDRHTAAIHTDDLGLRAAFVGEITMAGMDTPPSGWLKCDGSAVSRSTYSDLFAAIGTTYGVGNGSTTFNLPDLQARFPLGIGTGDAGTFAVGDEQGEHEVTLTSSQMPAHTHTGPSHTHTGPNHRHGAGSLDIGNDTHTHNLGYGLDSDTDHHHGNSQNYPAAAPSGYGSVGASTLANGYDTHDHTISGNTAYAGTGDTGAAGTGATGSTGGGSAHNNMPPSLALNFIIFTGV